MKAVLQRVSSAEVLINGKERKAIGQGLVVLLGVMEGDSEKEAAFLAEKVVNMRIFGDDQDKMNLSLQDIKGSMLIVSNFTLGADVAKGRRPSFVKAAKPPQAEELYEHFIHCVQQQESGLVETGAFGADMQITLINNGPVTILIDTEEILRK